MMLLRSPRPWRGRPTRRSRASRMAAAADASPASRLPPSSCSSLRFGVDRGGRRHSCRRASHRVLLDALKGTHAPQHLLLELLGAWAAAPLVDRLLDRPSHEAPGDALHGGRAGVRGRDDPHHVQHERRERRRQPRDDARADGCGRAEADVSAERDRRVGLAIADRADERPRNAAGREEQPRHVHERRVELLGGGDAALEQRGRRAEDRLEAEVVHVAVHLAAHRDRVHADVCGAEEGGEPLRVLRTAAKHLHKVVPLRQCRVRGGDALGVPLCARPHQGERDERAGAPYECDRPRVLVDLGDDALLQGELFDDRLLHVVGVAHALGKVHHTHHRAPPIWIGCETACDHFAPRDAQKVVELGLRLCRAHEGGDRVPTRGKDCRPARANRPRADDGNLPDRRTGACGCTAGLSRSLWKAL
mmetsp:Transcript_41165/g.96158  ORF Transcript_41165/g.96158 Transcript_41165/m.96158 type:complete len:419 (-) Transcript_41165:349-1605(-)